MNPHPPKAPAALDGNHADTHRRKLQNTAMAVALVVAASGFAFYWSQHLEQKEVTEDAYVEGNIVQVTSQVAGTIVAIGADNSDRVAVGQSVVKLNPLDAQLALERSEALLAKTVR